jgi:hypothetical protein
MIAATPLGMVTRADRAGTWLSLLCAVHCMASPLVVTILPLAGLSFLVQEVTEGFLLAASAALAAASLCWGFRLHRRARWSLSSSADGRRMAPPRGRSW